MDHALEIIRAQIDENISIMQRLAEDEAGVLLRIAGALADILRRGGTIYICGNGGSAADAQHAAAEFVGRFQRERAPFPAVSLATNMSIITAIANDYDFKRVFSRQVEAHVTEHDALVAISTSGKSQNVLEALHAARAKGALTISFTGEGGRESMSIADLCLCVASCSAGRIQEAHIFAWHLLIDLIEQGVV